MQILDFGYMAELFPYLLGKLPITLGMASAGMLCALVLASGLAIVRVVQPPLVNGAAKLFISFFRGTPLLVQLFLFYYGLPQLIESLVKIDGVTATILGLTLHFSAYMAESIRAAIVGIDRSQTEAALSIGMTQSQLMRRIVLPQATRIAVPTLMNYFIDMIKSTSLAFTLGVTELMGATQKEASSSFLYFEAFLTVAVIYWVVVELLSRLQKLMERKLNKAYQR
ncbi:amino acid ABC transporter permease [Larsenimonas suaedae]|uniref:Amino acid ABC transporter permease n=2 Tax=Larsenimonas suaedae TaxID=1851019 RepID=A0ABU1GS64_9GAMM|nr:amino acid ABC transporter permease [Larsenimonas suaedae]MCM2972345.1 amino acid ABC transporter permease [Larsenimonas suaedae]MDR5894859.1 amino acid ABC transporter permease [Larsenimonas suaedae]